MHSYDTKMEVIKMREEGCSIKSIMKQLGFQNRTQIYTWWRWYQNKEYHRFHQPVGKQYTHGKGAEGFTPEESLRIQNQSLKQQVELLKKYAEMEKRWYQK